MATFPGECDAETNKANTDIARGRDTEYIGVDNVIVRERDIANGTITVSCRLTNGTDQNFVLRWGDLDRMWPFCPSSLPSRAIWDDAGPPPEVGATGRLYLEHSFVTQNAISGGTPKWPKGMPGFPLARSLKLAPEKLVLTAVRKDEDDELVEGEVDLLDRTLAPPQTITIGAGEIEVFLTQTAAARFGASFPPDSILSDATTIIAASNDPDQLSQAWSTVATVKRWAESQQAIPKDPADPLVRVRGMLEKLLHGKPAKKG